MQKFTRLTRLALEAQIYKSGINVAMAHAEKTKVHKQFIKDTEHGLYQAILLIAKPENIERLTLFIKSPLEREIATLIAKRSIANYIDLEAYLVWAGTVGGQALLDKTKVQGVFGLTNPELINYFKDYTQLRIDSVDNTTKKWIAQQFQKAKEDNLTYSEIAQILKDSGKDISASRAEKIAVTELAQAMSKVEAEGAVKMGLQEWIWHTSLDERVCPICAPLEGKRANIGKSFGDGFNAPPAHVMCRCYMQEVIPQEWEADPWLGD